jgi:hypothetical protein
MSQIQLSQNLFPLLGSLLLDLNLCFELTWINPPDRPFGRRQIDGLDATDLNPVQDGRVMHVESLRDLLGF